MKMLKYWVPFLASNVAFMFLIIRGSSVHDETSITIGDSVTAATSIRRLMGSSNPRKKINEGGDINLEDYHRIDPVPSSSAAAITSGPIEHSTPLLPYIPKPAPPESPQYDGSPMSLTPPSPS